MQTCDCHEMGNLQRYIGTEEDRKASLGFHEPFEISSLWPYQFSPFLCAIFWKPKARQRWKKIRKEDWQLVSFKSSLAGCKCLLVLSLRRLWVPLNVSCGLVLRPVRGCTCHLSCLHCIVLTKNILCTCYLAARWSWLQFSVSFMSSLSLISADLHRSCQFTCDWVKLEIKIETITWVLARREYEDCRGTCVFKFCSVFPTRRVYSDGPLRCVNILPSIFGAFHTFSYNPSKIRLSSGQPALLVYCHSPLPHHTTVQRDVGDTVMLFFPKYINIFTPFNTQRIQLKINRGMSAHWCWTN